MVGAGLAAFNRQSARTRILFLVAGALLLVLLAHSFLFQAKFAKWPPATAAFCGFTNLPGGMCAILALENQSPTPLKLRNVGYLEYYRRRVNNSFNMTRSYTTGTNLVLQIGQRKRLFLPVSEEGTSWYVYLEFSPTGFRTKLAESLQQIHSSWVDFLPEGLRSIRSTPVILHLHREDPPQKSAESSDGPRFGG